MKIVVRKCGNSASVRIPEAVMAAANLRLGQRVDVHEENGRIIIEPMGAETYTLGDLIAGITEANRHDPIEFGPAVGQEAW